MRSGRAVSLGLLLHAIFHLELCFRLFDLSQVISLHSGFDFVYRFKSHGQPAVERNRALEGRGLVTKGHEPEFACMLNVALRQLYSAA